MAPVSPSLPRRATAAACLAGAVALGAPAAAAAQLRPPSVERAAPFDSAGRVLVLTPPLVARLGLRAPAWPIDGAFVEARLFDVAGGGSVLSVVRPSGVVERYALAPGERAALVGGISAAIVASAAGMRSDTSTVVSEPAGNAFVRTHAIRGLTAYGPAAAVLLADEPTAATLGYAIAAAAAYGTALAHARSHTVTRAQAYLSGNMAYGGAAAGAALVSLFDADDEKPYAAAVLAGGLVGTIAGVQRAASMTDAEAASSGTAALLLAGVTAGAAGAVGAFEDDAGRRAATGAAVVALAAGYLRGPAYARQRGHAVTAGDAAMLLPSALAGGTLGAALGLAVSDDDRVSIGLATAAAVAGTLLGDRAFVRRFDFTTGEAGLARLGALVGGAVGGALAASAEASEAGAVGLVGAGGLLGLALTAGVLDPAPAGGLGDMRFRGAEPVRPGARRGRPTLRLTPLNAAFVAAGARGRFPLASATF